MYLKSIELYGFKSFANKMVFNFDKGITGIVGPNGSGKSNVADAVRWVLGEQSAKQLRGSTMQDVIFAGTEARKPLGYCQVDLTIDNQDRKMAIDYSEVTVSRRVYRSGEGEYFINGAACRMRDVHELFMDTGVGQEGYSIIGQGQIDKILSDKPNERRALFDEAVGIVKFKKRKERAEKRLESEKQNLYRVNDIITELEGQKDTLKSQAEKAKVYLDVREELKTNEVNVFILDVKQIDEKLADLEVKMKTVSDDIASTRQAFAENKIKHEDYTKKMEVLVAQMDEMRRKASELSLQKEKKESEINLTRQQIQHYKENNERFLRDLEGRKNKKESLEKDLERYKDDSQSIFDESAKSEAALKGYEQELAGLNDLIGSEEKVVSDIQTNMIERLNEISNIKTQMQRYLTMSENAASRSDSVIARKSILQRSLDEFTILHRTETKKRRLLQSDQKKLMEEKNALVAKQKEDLQALKTIEEDRTKQSQFLQQLQSKHKALSDISDQYEGYNFSIKKVMEMRSDARYNNKIVGVVADVLTVAKKYERAIEIALGGNYQNIITEDEQSAKGLIRYLKERRYGRATFLPITNIKPRVTRNEQLRQADGFIGYADELVETKERFVDIATYLLGRIMVVDQIDNAIAISKKYKSNLRIVTLDGDVVNPGGSLTGGAYKNDKTQFLSRKRELDELQTRIDQQSKTLEVVDGEYQQLVARRDRFQSEDGKLTESLQGVSMDLNSQNMKIHQIDSDITKAEAELKDLHLEENDLLVQNTGITDELAKLESDLNENEVNREQAESTVKDLMSKTIELKEQKEALLSSMTQLKVRHTSLTEQKSHADSNITRMNGEIKEAAQAIERLQREIQENEVLISDKESSILNHKENIAQYESLVEEVDAQVANMSDERRQVAKDQEAVYKAQGDLGEKITLLEKELLRLENLASKNSLQKDNYIEYMWNEYELTYNNAMGYYKEDLGDINAIKKRVSELKGRIKGLGTVNVNAIEDYKNVAERYEFLTVQRDDIIEAETKLREAIQELDERMQQQFREQFGLINIEFQRVFKELFGGGKAFLRLSDEENVLEAGIHINVQPPGKKLQSMRLLSGGERAFTAIALLFAIQNLKPSPFCVLDEIEAALDDANVDRFAKYLQKLTKNTQFIIITHRRGTMEASDALYGITMQEKGISTQVSVKLIEDMLEV